MLVAIEGYKTAFISNPIHRVIPKTVVSKEDLHFGGGSVSPRERSDNPSSTAMCGSKPILFISVNFSKEGRRSPPNNQFESPKQIHPPCSFQNGGDSIIEGHNTATRFYDQTGSERCLFFNSSTSIPSELSELYVEKENLPVHLLAFLAQVLLALSPR